MITSSQQRIVLYVKKKIKKKNYFHNIFSYFAIFQNNPGTCLLKTYFNKKNLLSFLYSSLKHIYGIVNSEVTAINSINRDKEFKNIIISWAFRSSFKKNGVYHDKYLKLKSSDTKSTIWFLVYMDKELPNKIDENIILIHKKKNLLSGYYFFLSYFLFCLKNYSLNFKFFKYFNVYSFFSKQVLDIYKNNLNLEKMKNILIVYEGQIFQKEIIKFNKNKYNKLKNFAYDHSAPPPMPLNLVKDKFSPDILYVTGTAQVKHYCKNLLWEKDKIKVCKTLRFKDEKKENYLNKIYLPYELDNERKYLKNLLLLFEKENLNIKNFLVKPHPLKANDKKHIKFIEKIKKIVNKNRKIKKSSSSIFFGQTTAVIIALEFGISCYHICLDPVFDSYSQKLWPDIKVNQISGNLFKYELVKKKTFVNSSSKKNFKEIC